METKSLTLADAGAVQDLHLAVAAGAPALAAAAVSVVAVLDELQGVTPSLRRAIQAELEHVPGRGRI